VAVQRILGESIVSERHAYNSTEPLYGPERDPSWREQAACKDTPTAVFFPPRGDPAGVARAQAVCARCPVQVACHEYAVSVKARFGVWGGKSGRERRSTIRRAS